MNNSSLVAIGYARTSNASNPEASIPNQIETIEKYCKQNNILLKQVYVDEKKSGKSTNQRFEYQKMKEIVLQGKVDLVVVSFSDRLAREAYEFSLVMEQMKRHGVDFISVQDDLKGSNMSVLETAMIGIKNEMDSVVREKRTDDGKTTATIRERYPYGFKPFGYKKNKEMKLEINETEAEVVKWVYDAYEEGKSLNEICKHLLSRTPPVNRNYQSIGKMLERTIYTGEGDLSEEKQKRYPDLKIKAPVIISKEQFERVQKIRKPNNRNDAEFYFLTAWVFICPNCKGKLNVYAYKETREYYCEKGRGTKDKDCVRCEMNVLYKQVLTFLSNWIDSETGEVYKSDEEEELLRKKSQNELAFATGKIALKTFEINSHKIIQQYKELNSESFITPLSRIPLLKNFMKKENLAGIKSYMKQHGIQLTFDSQKNVVLFEES